MDLPVSKDYDGLCSLLYASSRLGDKHHNSCIRDRNPDDSLNIPPVFASYLSGAGRIVARHEEFFVIECRIPKGSKFWTGKFSEAKSYVSNRIEYVKVIKETGLFNFFNIQEMDEGKSFVCMWNEEKVEGKIHFENGEIFLCQNSRNGRDAVNKLGYDYSWVIIISSDAEDIKDLKIVG